MLCEDNPVDGVELNTETEPEMMQVLQGPPDKLGCKKRNGFFAFVNEHGAALRAMHPNMKGQRFRVRMGQVWQKLSTEEKLKYVNQTGHRPLPLTSLSWTKKLQKGPEPQGQGSIETVSKPVEVNTPMPVTTQMPKPTPPPMPNPVPIRPSATTEANTERAPWRPSLTARKTTVVPYVRPVNRVEVKKCEDYANVPFRILPKPLTKLGPTSTSAVSWRPATPSQTQTPKSDVKLILVQSSDPLLPKPGGVGPRSGEDGGRKLQVPNVMNAPKPSVSVSTSVGKQQGCFTRLTSSSNTSITIGPASSLGAGASSSSPKRRVLTAEQSEKITQCMTGQKRLIDKKMLDLIRSKAGGGDIRKVIFTNGGKDVISIMALPPADGAQKKAPSPSKEAPTRQPRPQPAPSACNGAKQMGKVGARQFLGANSDAGSSMVDVLIVDSGKALRSQMPLHVKDELVGNMARSVYEDLRDPEEGDDRDTIVGNVKERIESIRVKAENAGISREYQKPETILRVRKASHILQTRLMRGLRYNGKLDWKALAVSKMYVEESVLLELKKAEESVSESNRKVLMGVQVMRLRPVTEDEGHAYVVFRGNRHGQCLTAPEEVSIKMVPRTTPGRRLPSFES